MTKKYCIPYNLLKQQKAGRTLTACLRPSYNYFRLLFFDVDFDLTEALTPLFVEYTLTLPTRAKNPIRDLPFRQRTLRQQTPAHDHYTRDEML